MKFYLLLLILLPLLFLGCKEDSNNSVTPTNNLTVKWEQTSLSSGVIFALGINNISHLYSSISGDGFYKSTDNGSSWTKLVNGQFADSVHNLFGYAICMAFEGNELWVGTYGGGIYSSSDGGVTWKPLNLGPVNAQQNELAYNSKYHSMICASAIGTLRYLNGGWESVHSQWASDLAINSNGVIFSVGPNQPNFDQSSIRISSDFGINWLIKIIPDDLESIALLNNTTLIAAGSALYKTTDSGSNWTKLNVPFTDIVEKIRVSPEGYIFLGMENTGIYFSTDQGNTWTQANEGLTNLKVREITINPSGYIFVGTSHGGVFRAKYK